MSQTRMFRTPYLTSNTKRTVAIIWSLLLILETMPANWSVPALAETGLTGLEKGMPSVRQAAQRVHKAFSERSLAFEINQGQANKQVRFLARGDSYSTLLTNNDVVLAVNSTSKGDNSKTFDRRGEKNLGSQPTLALREVVRMKFSGANPHPRITGTDKLPYKSNYFIGSDEKKWHRMIQNYANVRISDVYPGVDVIYHSNGPQLQYDFVIAPGISPRMIKMVFSGIKGLRIDAKGDLILSIESGEFRQLKPRAYQEIDGAERVVPCRYNIQTNREVGFNCEKYDSSKRLIIDPTLVYSSFVGGSAEDKGLGISIDDRGQNVCVTGYTVSPDLPLFPASRKNVFVCCYNTSDLSTRFSTYIGGAQDDEGNAIKVDPLGNVYLTGSTTSDDFPVMPDAFQLRRQGSTDAFVTTLDAVGSIRLSTYLGGSRSDAAYGIAVNSLGDMYLTGSTWSPDFPHSSGPFGSELRGGSPDAFLAKVSSAGALVYSLFIGGSEYDYASGIALDDLGNAYVAGRTNSPDFRTTPEALRRTRSLSDCFVTAVRADGSDVIYSTYLGGRRDDECKAIAVDNQRNAYLTGITESDDFPTINAYQSNLNSVPETDGLFDAFVAKLDPTGSRLRYSTYLGGTGFEIANAIAIDSAGLAYITGEVSTYGDGTIGFPVTRDAYQTARPSNHSAFVTKLNTNASGSEALMYSTYLGVAGGWSKANGIAVFCGNFYLTGQTDSPSFPILAGMPAFGGGRSDAFLARFDDAASLPCALPLRGIRIVFYPCWGENCVVDPWIGTVVDPRVWDNPDWCPICKFVVVANGRIANGTIKNIVLNKKQEVQGLTIENGKLRAFDIEGNEMPLRFPVQTTKREAPFASCQGCLDVLKAGGVIRGLVIEKGRLRALFVDFGMQGKPTLGNKQVPARGIQGVP